MILIITFDPLSLPMRPTSPHFQFQLECFCTGDLVLAKIGQKYFLRPADNQRSILKKNSECTSCVCVTLLSPGDNFKRSMISKLKVGGKSNTWAVVTPIQSVSRQWPPESEYTTIVNHASLSTLALFISILHRRLQWSLQTMKTPYHIHRTGVISGLLHLHWVRYTSENCTFRPWHLLLAFLLWLFILSDFRTVCIW